MARFKNGVFAILVAAVFTTPAPAAPFTPGNLIVVMTDGTIDPQWHAYSDTAGPVTLIEFTTALPDPLGAEAPAVQSMVMPTAISGPHKRFVLPPGGVDLGNLTLSTNGLLLVLAGYDADVGTLEVVKTPASMVNRVIALVDAAGNVDTQTGLTDCYHNGTKPIAGIRMAATDNGVRFWIVGKDGASSNDACTRFALRGATTSLRIDSEKKMTEPVAVNIFDGQLFVSAWNNSTRRGVVHFGTGLPETPLLGPEITLVAPGQPPADSDIRSRDFWFQNRTTLYVADQREKSTDPLEPWYGGVGKFILDETPESPTFGTFVYQYTLNAGLPTGIHDAAIRYLTGRTDGQGHAVLYGVAAGDDSGGNKLMTLTDTGCPTGTEAGCSAADAWVTMHTAPPQMVFKGVEWTPRACAGDECLGACCHAGGGCSNGVVADACDGMWAGVGTTCEGFTCPAGICPRPFADADLDKDVDMQDFAQWQRCLTSQGSPMGAGCACFDRPEPGFPDGNGVIDQGDLTAFLACASGADVPAELDCANPE